MKPSSSVTPSMTYWRATRPACAHSRLFGAPSNDKTSSPGLQVLGSKAFPNFLRFSPQPADTRWLERGDRLDFVRRHSNLPPPGAVQLVARTESPRDLWLQWPSSKHP